MPLAQAADSDRTRLFFTEPAPFTTAELIRRCSDKVVIVHQPGTAQYHLSLGIAASPLITWYSLVLFDATTGNAVAVFRTRTRSGLAKDICQYFIRKGASK
jgi:hypothetical protein